jgi:hypothetical protein
MLFRLWETITGYLASRPYWARIQPYVTLASLYLTTQVLAYQFLASEYHMTLSVTLFLHSYVFKQVTLAFGALAAVVLIFTWRPGASGEKGRSDWQSWLVDHTPLLRRATLATLVVAAAAIMLGSLAPKDVSNIRIRFLGEPTFDKYAFVYLVYELNKLQQNWYFEVDYDEFDERELKDAQRETCHGAANRALCYSQILAGSRPFIGITSEGLGEDYFGQSLNQVAVVSTYGWPDDSPPSVYDFLAYTLVVQGILIHLNAHCHDLAPRAVGESRVAYGDLFQFVPRRNAMKPTVLAAHLSRQGHELLLNCFGAKYLSVTSKLITLEWLHSTAIRENLEKSFRIKL